MSFLYSSTLRGPEVNSDLPPGAPGTRDYSGPWFRTQLVLSLSLGISSFLLFSILRTRWKKVFMGRRLMLLRSSGDTSPSGENGIGGFPILGAGLVAGGGMGASVVYDDDSTFGWVMATLRVSERAVLDEVGLDAVVLLDFLKTSLQFFSLCAIAAVVVLMPVHFTRGGSTDGDGGGDEGDDDDDDDGDGHKGGDGGDEKDLIAGLGRTMVRKVARRALRKTARTTVLSVIETGLSGNHTELPTQRSPSWLDLVIDPQTTISLHLLFTYFFSILALYMLHRNFHRFLRARQAFSLSRRESVPARTCLVSNLPDKLRSDKALREYFEKDCGWKVESAMVVVEVGKELKEALAQRDEAMRGLERSWTLWTGEKQLPEGRIRLPADEEGSNGASRDRSPAPGIESDDAELTDVGRRSGASVPPSLPVYRDNVEDDTAPRWGEETAPRWEEIPRAPPAPHALEPTDDLLEEVATPRTAHQADAMKSRPMVAVPKGWLQWFMPFVAEKVDAIDYWQDKFDAAEAKVKVLREEHEDDGQQEDAERPNDESARLVADHSNGGSNKPSTHRPWKPTGDAFVTFESITDAELAAQVVHFPEHSQCQTELAPDSEDIIWANMGLTPRERYVRSAIVQLLVLLGLLFWAAPVSALASLLSFKSIQKVAPWLARLIDQSPAIGALVQTTLPSSALIIFNAVVPFIMEYMCYFQGFRSKSAIETSLLRKYTLFLIFTVLLVFLVATTAYSLFVDLAGTPQKIPNKLAQALTKGNARAFSMSYVMLSGMGTMPTQLLNLGTIFFIGLYRAFFTRTPRDMVELYTPPAINYGFVYPPAILIFITSLIYSVLSPLILIFAAIYFGVTFLVYKYKLLYVFVNRYESTGEAWPTTFARLIWGISLFQIFMAGTFAVRKSVVASVGMLPLLAVTVVWSWKMREDLAGLSRHTALSAISTAEETLSSDGRSISLRYATRLPASQVYSQMELSRRLPKPWVAR